jgi:hypothetical protein
MMVVVVKQCPCRNLFNNGDNLARVVRNENTKQLRAWSPLKREYVSNFRRYDSIKENSPYSLLPLFDLFPPFDLSY